MKNSQEICIELLNKNDLPEVIAIEALSFSSPWKTNQFIDNSDQFYVAKINGKLVGFIGIEKIQDEARVTHMAVHPIYRKQGVGKKLLSMALKFDVTKFILEVRESNIIAQKLYGSFGFKEVSRRKKYYNNNNEDALVMIYEKKPT